MEKRMSIGGELRTFQNFNQYKPLTNDAGSHLSTPFVFT